ncbi:DUF445 family protein [Flammeovirga kamogawensis]|uniref:DUF445 family protein n=1 Tax=Flammeovirga kamogawensis TaxID=373891 RepID=A0ABX8GW70_9BACT|nr:DUF445 family protein [Flammeovirga kamogawensis]MBB6461070.1 uncharacterized membrane protein YheB (UPF0754 family) [Flammeovirga kamogawensis]QWG07638.1 DUF445 family protein [Flammeovirga kamogawensis]TRX69448.1 DUF445 family protein [Flammeovirga kamogawensis]
MISELILKIFSGAVVGYTTNDLALRMLFEKVLGIPSIVEQTKESFIQNISKLVESEIIRHDNISVEVQKDNFKDALLVMLTDFVEIHLRAEFKKDEIIADIPNIDKSIDRLIAIIDENFKDSLRKGLNGLLQNTVVSDFTSKQQVAHISDSILELVLTTLSKDHLVESLTNDIWHELKREQTQSIIAPILFDSISNYSEDFFDELHTSLKDGKLPLNQFIDKLLFHFESDQLIDNLSESISQKSISDFIGAGDHQNIAKEVHRILISEFKDPSDNAPIKRLIRIFIEVIGNEKTTIFELLPPAIGQNFEKFLRKNIPIILDGVVEWIQENREEINQIVNQSFEEQSSFMGKWVMNLFVDSVSERFKVVDEIINIANNQKNEENSIEIAQKGANFMVEYLKTNSIGSLINRFDQKGLINTIHGLIISLVDEKLVGQGADSMSLFLDKKIGNIWSKNRRKNDLNKLVNFLIDEQLISEFLYKRKSTEKGKKIVKDRLNKIKEQPLYSLFTDQTIHNFAKKTQVYTEKTLREEKVGISVGIEKVVWEEISNKRFSKFIGPNSIEKWSPKIKKFSISFLRDAFNKGKKRPIHDLVAIAEKSTSLPRKMTEGIIGYINRNINRLMKGQVSRIVADNLHNKHKELPSMVKGFMGSNMKPITYFGAILGAIAGGLTAYIPLGDNVYTMVGAIAGVYGVTGLATNWIAIKMIFRPYKAVKIFGMKMPFTPSVISKNQSKFADNMGDFVGKQLLNEESIGSDLTSKLTSLRTNIYTTFVESDYKTLDVLLETEKKGISKKISKVASHQLFSNRYAYAEIISKKIEKELFSENKFSDLSLQTTFIDFAHKDIVYNALSSFLSRQVIKILDNDLMLNDAIPDKFIDQMFGAVKQILSKQIDNTNQWVQDDVLFIHLKNIFRDKFIEYRTKSLNEIPIFEKNKTRIKESIWNGLIEALNEDSFQERLLEFFESQIEQLSNKELPIRDLFGGKPYEALQENSIQIVDQLINHVIKHLRDNDEKFAQEVYDATIEKRKMAMIYEGNIKRTTKELTNNKIPDLLRRGLPEITQKIQNKLSVIAKDTKVKDLEIELKKGPLQEGIKNLLNNNRLLTSIQFVLNRIVDEIFDTKIENILSVGSISKGEIYEHLNTNLTPEIKIVRNHIQEQLYDKNKKDLIVDDLNLMIKDISKKLILSKKVNDIFKNTDADELKNGIENTFKILLKSRSTQNTVSSLASNLAITIENQGITSIIQKEQFLFDLEKGIAKTLENNKNQEVIREITKNMSIQMLNNFNKCLTKETKNYLLDKVLDGLIKSASPHIGTLIRNIDFKDIVVTEINQMDPAKIEELFYGFAGMYFKRLIIYGFFLGLPIGAMLDFGLLQLVTFLIKK